MATRLGEVPVDGVKVKLGTKDLGISDKDGKVSDSEIMDDAEFELVAEYFKKCGNFKKEVAKISIRDINFAKRKCLVQTSNTIENIQDVGGVKNDIRFNDPPDPKINPFMDDCDDVSIQYSINDIFDIKVKIKLATLSLQVDYINQNYQEDTVETIPGTEKDPEPASHEVLPRSRGRILCFPTSVAMLLSYWGVNTARQKVMQETYKQWAEKKFPGRIDKNPSALVTPTGLADPPFGKYWLDTSTLVPAKGFPMKRALSWVKIDDFTGKPHHRGIKEPPKSFEGQVWKDTKKGGPVFKQAKREWSEMEDADWRVLIGKSKVWTVWGYEELALNSLISPKEFKVCRRFHIEGWHQKKLPDDIFQGRYLDYLRDRLAKGLPTVVGTKATESGHIMILRGCVVNRAKSVEWLIFNDPYGNLASPGSLYENISLTSTVGLRCQNLSGDVVQVQKRLKDGGSYKGPVTGICKGNDALVKAIKRFQLKKKCGLKEIGRVAPGSKTLKALNELFATYHGAEGEANVAKASGEGTKKGQHVYYNRNTRGFANKFILAGKEGGGLMLMRKKPLATEEIAERLTKDEP